jgi:uncharacterized delta-60 repeat protein
VLIVSLLAMALSANPAHPQGTGFNPGADGPIDAMAVQPDGRIVVGGGFTSLGGQPRDFIGRLNADGSLDTTFNPGADGPVIAITLQPDGKIVVAGEFTTLGGQPRSNIGRLHANGSLDAAFDPGADFRVHALALAPDGKIVVGGVFAELGGKPRSYLGRLNANGTLDEGFAPEPDGVVDALAVQADGKVMVGGEFITTLGGQPCSNLGRLNANGSRDATFTAGADGFVYALALQADGKILVGGEFITTLGGQPRSNIGRLTAAGGVDAAFDPGADGAVWVFAVQPDGKIVVGGEFTSLGGQPRAAIGRLTAGGSVDPSLDPGADGPVVSLAVQADGKIVVGGLFQILGGQQRANIGRLNADGSLEVAGGLAVELVAPFTFAPGGVEAFSVAYSNGSSQTVKDAVVLVALPSLGDLVDDSGGGILWPQRQQLFWRLGDLAAGHAGLVSFRVRFYWGTPNGTTDPTVALISGSNVDPAEFDVQPYLDYQPVEVVEEHVLSTPEVVAERQAYAELDQLYAQAEEEGFLAGGARSRTFSTGGQETEVTLLRFDPEFAVMWLQRQGTLAQAVVVDAVSFTVRTVRAVERYSVLTDQWETVDGAAGAGLSRLHVARATFGDCMKNCILDLVPEEVAKQVLKGASAVSKTVDCFKAANTRDALDIAKCGDGLTELVPGLGTGIDLGRCNSDCQQNPNSHFCTSDKRSCDSGGFPYGTVGIDTIVTCKCVTDPDDVRLGQYLPCETTGVCAICEKCVQGAGGPACVAKSAPAPAGLANARLRASSTESKKCTKCDAAKDPNAKYGVAGDVFPGQTLTYTITYENVGTGEAFDVFVVDTLSDAIDADTIVVADGGEYLAASRTVIWQVGQLAPKGQLGSTGEVGFTASLKPDLAVGTVVANQAVVHFPSVPEETPTNEVINVVRPIAAVPQSLETVAGRAVAIHLAGRGPAGVSLSTAVVERPLHGDLAGTPPDLSYTPAADFSGLDRLRFTASDGITTSRPDDVLIRVLPDPADVTPPRIVRTSPADREFVARIGAAPRFSDSGGPVYLPGIQVEFSESVDAATITSGTVRLSDAAGRQLPLRVSYDDLVNQAMALPREPLRAGARYAVTVTTGVTDLNGNHLAADRTWTFQAGSRLRLRGFPHPPAH